MSYKYERVSGEPIIIVHLFEDFNFKTDLETASPEAARILDGVDTPVFWIVNVLTPMDVEDLLLATQDISHGENALWKHPNIRQTVVVSQDALVAAAVPGFKTEQFGSLNVEMVATLDQALAYARSQL